MSSSCTVVCSTLFYGDKVTLSHSSVVPAKMNRSPFSFPLAALRGDCSCGRVGITIVQLQPGFSSADSVPRAVPVVVHSLQRCGAELLCQCESSSRCCLTLRASTVISGLLRMIQSSLGQRAGTGVTQDKEIQSQALTALAWQLNLSKAIQLLLRAHLTPCGPALSQETLESSASTLWDPEDDPA